jgi:hypothetical protein
VATKSTDDPSRHPSRHPLSANSRRMAKTNFALKLAEPDARSPTSALDSGLMSDRRKNLFSLSHQFPNANHAERAPWLVIFERCDVLWRRADGSSFGRFHTWPQRAQRK